MDLEEDGRAGWGCPGGVQVSGVGAVAVVRPLTWWPFVYRGLAGVMSALQSFVLGTSCVFNISLAFGNEPFNETIWNLEAFWMPLHTH